MYTGPSWLLETCHLKKSLSLHCPVLFSISGTFSEALEVIGH